MFYNHLEKPVNERRYLSDGWDIQAANIPENRS
jgi:hypothetical protein